jgi:hypothetical protein
MHGGVVLSLGGKAAEETPMQKIAVVQGAPSSEIQALFRDLVARWRPALRIAGVIEEHHELPDRKCSAGYLRSIATGARYPIFQDLGPGADACHLEGSGALTATADVERGIAGGCDLVVLSKFGKLESIGQGLSGAFKAALTAGVPVLTTVSPSLMPRWTAFASPLFVSLPADPAQIDTWRRAVAAGASVQ